MEKRRAEKAKKVQQKEKRVFFSSILIDVTMMTVKMIQTKAD